MLRQCERYYIRYGSTTFVGSGACNTTALAYIVFNAAPMRATPTINQSGCQLYTGSVISISSIGTVYGAANQPAIAAGINATGLTAGQGATLYTNNGFLELVAEL